MKIQNIFRMQAIAIGVLGAALLIPTHAKAQEISNTEWAGGPDTQFDQPTKAAVPGVAVATTPNDTQATTQESVVSSSPVAVAAAFADMSPTARAWVVTFGLFLLMIMIGIYCVVLEVRRTDRNLGARPPTFS